MTLEDLRASLSRDDPPSDLPETVQALWHDARGDWDRAHLIAQDFDGPDGSWVHAYLHRKEGDLSNASYWYRRAGRIQPRATLEQEWEQIANALLG